MDTEFNKTFPEDQENEQIVWWKKRSVQIGALVVLVVLLLATAAVIAVRSNNSTAERENTDSAQLPEETTRARRIDGVQVEIGKENLYPVAVMIENLSSIRPQAGLSEASVVYEALAEGGITRFMALYAKDIDLERIGPVRSAREYYVDIAEEYHAVYAHAGGSPGSLSAIARSENIVDLNAIGESGRYFHRDNRLAAPHNLFTSEESLAFALRDKGVETTVPEYRGWKFEERAVAAQKNATSIRIPFSSAAYLVEYTYDAQTKRYLRLNGGQPHLDENTDEQLSTKTILVQFAQSSATGDDKGRIDVNVRGNGRALMFVEGVATEGEWEYSNSEERTIFRDSAGNEMVFLPGTIWVEIVPTDAAVEYTALEAQVESVQ